MRRLDRCLTRNQGKAHNTYLELTEYFPSLVSSVQAFPISQKSGLQTESQCQWCNAIQKDLFHVWHASGCYLCALRYAQYTRVVYLTLRQSHQSESDRQLFSDSLCAISDPQSTMRSPRFENLSPGITRHESYVSQRSPATHC